MKTKNNNEDIIEYPLSENEVEKNFLKETNTSNFIGRKRMNELQINKYYFVDKLERISTKFGFRILVTLHIDENK